MGQGLRVWNADGTLQFDSSVRLSRTSGILTITAGATGSVVVPNGADGTIWYSILPTGGSWYLPGVTISGSTISWGPSSLYTPAVDVQLVYGIY